MSKRTGKRFGKKIKCKACDIEFLQYYTGHICCSRACYDKVRYVKRRKALRAYRQKYYKANRLLRLAQAKKWREEGRASYPWFEMLRTAQWTARKKKIPYDLNHEWASSRWTGCCELTGIPFGRNEKRGSFSPSLDRRDPELGYTQHNCRFVLWGVNMFKSDGSEADMYRIAEALVAKHPHLPPA